MMVLQVKTLTIPIFTVKYSYMYVPSQVFVNTVHLLVRMLLYLAIIVE